MPFSKVYKVPRVVNLTGFGLWTYNGMLLWMDDMLYLTAYGHGGCCNKSSVNQATRYRYRGCQLLPSRLCQSAQGFSDFLIGLFWITFNLLKMMMNVVMDQQCFCCVVCLYLCWAMWAVKTARPSWWWTTGPARCWTTSLISVMDVTISLTRQSVKLYMMLWIYGHLSVGIYLSQRIFW